jgi:ribosomal protein S18 acetylase RimI-like enzyme
MTERIRLLESLAFDAWPAEDVVDLGGWRLRFNRGLTHRANSVWPNAWHGDDALSDRLDRVEAMYAERGLPALFQVTPAALPQGLDATLANRDYVGHLPTEVWTAPLARCALTAAPPGIEVLAYPDVEPAWWSLNGERGRFRKDELPLYLRLLERLRGRACFVLASLDGELGATGIGVVGADRVGIFSMRTLEGLRGRGLARAVLGGIARFAAERSATELYLQVERDNQPARALYAKAGFDVAYAYHYRERAAVPDARST